MAVVLAVMALQLAVSQPNAAYNDRLQTAAARFLRGEDMDCTYPGKIRWWRSLSQEAIPILRERNPNAMFAAVNDCLNIAEVERGDWEEAEAVLSQYMGIVDAWAVNGEEEVGATAGGAGTEVEPPPPPPLQPPQHPARPEDDCMAGWAGEDCDRCAPGHSGSKCAKDSAAAPAAAEDDCMAGWAGEDCDRCAPGHSGSKCAKDSAAAPAAAEDDCMAGWAGEDCDRCAPGHSGSKCAKDAAAVYRVTCELADARFLDDPHSAELNGEF